MIIKLFAQDFAQPALWFKTFSDSVVLHDIWDNTERIAPFPDRNKLKPASINGHPAVDFVDAAAYFSFVTDSLPETRQLTVMIAYTSYEPDSTLGIWFLRNTDKKHIFLTGNTIGNGKRRIPYSMPAEKNAIVNTSVHVLDRDAVSLAGSDTLYIGRSDSLYFQGKIAEFVVAGNISPRERRQWQTYLSLKYGASMHRDDYLSSWGSTLWRYSANRAYSSGIAGIGRDDFFGLVQHQSRIGNDSVTIAINGIQDLQHQHPLTLHNRDFLLWGHNGEALEPAHLLYFFRDSIPFELESRRWLMRPYISFDTIYTTEVMRAVAVGKDPAKLFLLINRTEEFNTQLTGIEIYRPDSISGNKAFFRNIVWDTDGSGFDYFTFGYSLGNAQFDTDNNTNAIHISGAEAVFTEARLFPNPVINNLHINYKLTRQATIWFSLHNSLGMPVRQTAPLNQTEGYHSITIDMSGQPTGAYTLYVHVDDMVLKKIVIKT
jgi:hypothetical protein